ncbi:SurA N-terminal domain-containing protein [Candidatus Saccharibacteria bacterium]|nr:SurA N-terminal domain-containing protein [Candidatus Saccharibacteria bacterium]
MSLLKKKDAKKTEQEKVDERRSEVLSKGRKFKYPLQWTRHRVVINAILIAIVVIAMIVIGGWLALYRFNMTDEILFRVTKVIPVPVATVDGENVPFSDYLMLYRSSMTSIERQSGSQFDEESLNQLRTEYKKSALTEAEKYTYATKLAKELDITVSNEEVQNEFQRHLSIGGIERSEESFVKIIGDNFGLSKSEYERMLYLSLLKSKVEMAIDNEANQIADKVEKLLAGNNNDYQAVAQELGDKISYQETNGLVDSKNIDGGRATEAMKLEPGQSSGKFISINGDGYYFVKLISKTDSQVNFVSIRVPFTEFTKRFDSLRQNNQIIEYITLDQSTPESQPQS